MTISKFLSVLLAALMAVGCFASCGGDAPTVTDPALATDAPDVSEVTEPVTTEDPGSEESDEPFVEPLDPTYDPEDEGGEEDVKKMIFDYDFAAASADPEGFSLALETMELIAGAGYKNSANNGILRVVDKNVQLKGKSIMVEADITFDTLPHKADGVTNFPLSIISWIRKTASETRYDWAFKLDDEGYLYIKDTSTRTETKIEAGRRYTFGVLYDENESTLQVYVDGVLVGVNKFAPKELIGSSLRFFDGGAGKAHFDATIHSARAYLCSATDLLKDAERSIFEVLAEKPKAQTVFVGYTDKDALSYKVGEEMVFDIYLLADSEVVSAPYFYYSVETEDGQAKTEGYVDGSKGHFTVKAKSLKPGAVRVKAYACDENKVKQTKSNSVLYVDLETSTPQKSDLMFKGGAIAGLEQISAGGKIPADLKSYWDKVISECYKGDIKLLRFDELDPADFNGTDAHSLYLVEIECEGGFATGYLTVPKKGDKLKLKAGFVSYGNKKKPTPSFSSDTAVFSICAHSYHLDDPNAAAPSNYGFSNTENANPDTVYFKNMFIRNLTATRFLKAYVGDGSYGKIVYGGSVVAPLNKWSVGDKYSVSGGSQASFQSVAIAAFDSDVTHASFGVPWFCDIGGDLVGRFDGWNPDYTDALMYYDSVSLATLIEKDVEVTITAGLGDTTSEPSGVVALYNALNCKVTMSMTQNREHTYNPPIAKVYKVSK